MDLAAWHSSHADFGSWPRKGREFCRHILFRPRSFRTATPATAYSSIASGLHS